MYRFDYSVIVAAYQIEFPDIEIVSILPFGDRCRLSKPILHISISYRFHHWGIAIASSGFFSYRCRIDSIVRLSSPRINMIIQLSIPYRSCSSVTAFVSTCFFSHHRSHRFHFPVAVIVSIRLLVSSASYRKRFSFDIHPYRAR